MWDPVRVITVNSMEIHMAIEIKDYKTLSEGKAKGEFTVYLTENKYNLKKCKEYVTDGRTWVGLPVFTEGDGDEKKFIPYFEFSDNTHHNKFLSAVSKAVTPFIKEINADGPKDQLNLL